MLIAYHNRPDLKTAILAGLAAHRAADEIVHGTYWQNGKGCAVGCTLHTVARLEGLTDIAHGDHGLYEEYLGVPVMLARLEDGLFEALPNGEAKLWPERFAGAIRPGADLSMVGPKFLLDLLANPDGAVQARASRNTRVASSVQAVVELYGRWIEGVKPSIEEWHAARNAAYAASAASAAASAVAAASAAVAASAASAVAAASAAAAAAAAARVRERRRQADALIRLLEAA